MKKLKEAGTEAKAMSAGMTFFWFIALMLADAVDELRGWVEKDPIRAFQVVVTIGLIGIALMCLCMAFHPL